MKTAIVTSKIWNGGRITKDMFEEMQGAMFDSAKRIAVDARRNVPLGPGKPKHLRDTIRARSARKGKVEMFIHGLATGEYETKLPVAYVFAGNRLEGVYWHYMVEYGTYDKPAHPYMRPAVDVNFNPTLAEAERAVKYVLKKWQKEWTKRRRGRTR